MRTYYIYKVTNKINGKIYIGKTGNFKERRWQHERCYEKEDCVFHRAIQKYGKENFEWEIIDEASGLENAYELEKKYIKEYNSHIKDNGYNMTKGGAGGAAPNVRPIVCLTLSGKFVKKYESAAEAEREDGFNNVNVLLNCKEKLLTCKNHMFMFEDDYLKNGAKIYKKPKSPRARKIIQCDMNGNFINEYKSVQEAASKTGANRTTISGVLSGTYKSANGFIFIYKEDFPIKDISKYKKCKKGRKIAQVDINSGKIIKVFDRISDAGKELGVSYKPIHKVVDMPDRTAYGYKWISQ